MATKVEVYDIVREGTKVVLPVGALIPQVIKSLEAKFKEEDEDVVLKEDFSFYPSEGAVALGKVLSRRYGFATQEASTGMFGQKQPPGTIAVEVAYKTTIQVPWSSKVAIPSLEGGVVVPMVAVSNGMPVFRLVAQFKGRYRYEFMELCQDLRETVARESIYKGASIEFRWPENDDPSETPPEDWFPRFLAPSTLTEGDAIFPEQTARDISANVYAPVKFTGAMVEAKMPLRTGVLLHGPYGCGKTLVRGITQGLCEKHGWSYVYCPTADLLLRALQFVKTSGHGPTVLSCEDIDTFEGDVNLLQNRLDDVDSKSIPIKLVVTTNFIERIQEKMPALMRDGRLGVHIPIGLPDKAAAELLIRRYAGEMLVPGEALGTVSEALDGWLPASIAGVVEAAQRYALDRQEGWLPIHLTAKDLLDSAGHQREAAQRATEAHLRAQRKDMGELERAATIVAQAMMPETRPAKRSNNHDTGTMWGRGAQVQD